MNYCCLYKNMTLYGALLLWEDKPTNNKRKQWVANLPTSVFCLMDEMWYVCCLIWSIGCWHHMQVSMVVADGLVLGHQQPSWWHMSVSTFQECSNVICCQGPWHILYTSYDAVEDGVSHLLSLFPLCLRSSSMGLEPCDARYTWCCHASMWSVCFIGRGKTKQWGMSSWRPLLGLLSWYPVM